MECKKCGQPLMETDKFCQFCGTPVVSRKEEQTSAPVQNAGTNNTWSQPGSSSHLDDEFNFLVNSNSNSKKKTKSRRGSRKPSRLPLIIGGISAAVLVVVLVVVLIVTGRPSVKVASAMTSTLNELGKISKAASVSELPELLKKDSLSQDLDITFQSVDSDYMGNSAAEGLGISVKADMSLPKHELGFQATPYYGSVEICSISMAMREEMVYFAMPEILPDPYYSFSTETIIQDLGNLGVPMGEMEGISFNFFELVEMVREETETASKETQEALKEAEKALVSTLEVEKDGKRSIRVNGTNTKCTAYKVTVSQDALEDWIQALEDGVNAMDQKALAEMVLEGMNMPGDLIDEVLYEVDTYEIGFDEWFDILDEIGDIELDVYVSGGKVSAVKHESEVYGSDLEIALYIGGGENYVDDITLEITSDGETLSVESSGNHTGKGGIFTDETVISVPYGGELVMETELETKGDGALSFSLDVDGDGLEAEGYFQASGSSLTLNLEELTLIDSYSGDMTLSVNYAISDYQRRVKESNARHLSDLTEDDLMDIMEEVEDNAMDWASDLMEEIPELMYLF